MSRGINKCILVGNLGKDPEVKHLPSGGAVVSFSVGTNESWKDKHGEKQERCEWHNCTVFGKLADVCAEYLNKGSQVYIEGSIRTEKWTDKEGKDRYTTKIIVREMQMLGGKREGSDRSSSSASSAQSSSAESDAGGALSDDIPFVQYEHGTIA